MPCTRHFQVRDKPPENPREKSPEHGCQTKTSPQVGWFTNQEWNDLFNPHIPKVPASPPPSPPPTCDVPPSPQKINKHKPNKDKPTPGQSVKTYSIKRHCP